MTSRSRLPETVSIKDLAQQMERQGRIRPTASAASNVSDRRALLAAHSLAVRSPDNCGAALQAGQDVDGWMMLRCIEVECYDRNPRTRTNPRYAEIRASIEARGGLGEALSVTLRPGASRHMCYMGGNTRLQIVQELWHETKDPRYEWLRVVVHPWVSEADVIAAHLIENELRADTTFWEKARGVTFLKGELESDLGRPLSLRALSEHANRCGLKLHAVTASNYLFATEQLAALGPRLTHESAGAIRSRHGHLGKLADALNLDPYLRANAFRQLVENAATELNPPREQADTPRLTVAEVERILALMNAQLAQLASCSVRAVEQALRAVMGAEKQLSACEIRALMAHCEPSPASAVASPISRPRADQGAEPEGEEEVAGPSSSSKRTRSARHSAEHDEADSTFAAALNGFAAPFRIDACVHWDCVEARGFRVTPIADGAESLSEAESRARQGAHGLLAHLAGPGGTGDAGTQQILSLLLEPSYWPLTRALMDSYHRQFVPAPRSE